MPEWYQNTENTDEFFKDGGVTEVISMDSLDADIAFCIDWVDNIYPAMPETIKTDMDNVFKSTDGLTSIEYYVAKRIELEAKKNEILGV